MAALIGTILLAHGSRSPGQLEVITSLAAKAQARCGAPWTAAFLDHHGPVFDEAAAHLVKQGCDRITVVPALLSNAFHASSDVPAAISTSPTSVPIDIAEPIGPDPALFAVLDRRLDRISPTSRPIDSLLSVVVAAAGTSNATARGEFVDAVGSWQPKRRDVTVIAAFIAGGTPDIPTAVGSAHATGRTVVLAPFVLAHGTLLERARLLALEAGAGHILPAIGADDEVVTILLDRRAACATV